MDKSSLISDEENTYKNKVDALKIEAKELNEKLLNLKWKIKRTDFLAYYEDKEREGQLIRINNMKEMVDDYEEKTTGVDAEYEDKTNILKMLQATDKEHSKELEHLRAISQKNESTIAELNRSINVLKNRNAAMMTKLKKQKENFDEQIIKMSEQMQ